MALSLVAQPQSIIPVVDENATMQDKLGASAALDATFQNEAGEAVRLRDMITGDLPVVLNLGYYGCAHACGPIYNALVDGLKNAELVPGRDLEILSVSIDEHETPQLAKDKKASLIGSLGIPAAAKGWHFLTGDVEQIRKISDSVGYRFRRLENTAHIDHPPTVVFLAKDGTVTRYLNGIVMSPVTLRTAVIEASDGTVGSFLERILISCLTFDTSSGNYSVEAMTIMRIAGALTVLALGTMIFVLWRRERRKRPQVAVT